MEQPQPPAAIEYQSTSIFTSRRSFLRSAAAGAAALMAARAGMRSLPTVLAAGAVSPDAALERLREGNRRFVAGRLTTPDLHQLRRELAHKQEPFAAILTCADSRIPVEMVFDQSMGDLFVTRVAGNMVTPEIIASLEYGAAVLGTKAIMVLGHSDCGAIKAAIAAKPVPGQISALYPHLQPAVDQAGPDVAAVTRANAKIQARLLERASTVIAERVKAGEMKVVAAYYDIATGAVTSLP